MLGRIVLFEEQASPNYFVRQVRHRRTGEVTWEILDAASGSTVTAGILSREDAVRIVRAWERLSQRLEGGLEGHVLVH